MTSPLMDEIARNIERRMELVLKVDKLEAAIQRVRDLHKPIATRYPTGKEYTGCAVCSDEGWDEIFYPHEYPCDTIKALDGDSHE